MFWYFYFFWKLNIQLKDRLCSDTSRNTAEIDTNSAYMQKIEDANPTLITNCQNTPRLIGGYQYWTKTMPNKSKSTTSNSDSEKTQQHVLWKWIFLLTSITWWKSQQCWSKGYTYVQKLVFLKETHHSSMIAFSLKLAVDFKKTLWNLHMQQLEIDVLTNKLVNW